MPACPARLALDPDRPGALFDLRRARAGARAQARGLSRLIALYRARPNHGPLLHYLAYLLRLSNLVDAALDADLRTIAADPTQPWAYWMYGRVAVEAGRVDEARSMYARIERAATRATRPRGRSS